MNIFTVTYELQDVSTSIPIVSNQLWLDGNYDLKANADLGAGYFNAKIKITCGNEVFYTNVFKIEIYCPPIIQGAFPSSLTGI